MASIINYSGKNVKSKMKKHGMAQFCFLLPALALFTLFIVYPAGTSLFYSFTDWSGIGKNYNFINFDNYVYMFTHKEIWSTIPTTFYYAALNAVTLIVVAFFVALALNRSSKITGFMRICFFIPMLVSPLIVGFVFKEFYSPVLAEDNMGTLNRILTMVGLPFLRTNWLGNEYTAMLVIVLTGIWYQVGQTALIYLANMQTIPKELYEAAKIDGAGYWSQTRYITFSMIAPALKINVILLLINSLKQYDMISILTGGGPGTATKVINLAIVESTISSNKVGLGSAMSMIVTGMVFILVTAAQKLLSKLEDKQ